MITWHPSITQKILLSYLIIGLLVTLISLTTVWELHRLDQQIIIWDKASHFFDAILELRRFEKNYFLYNELDDLTEALTYLKQARELLAQPVFLDLAETKLLRQTLTLYQQRLQSYSHFQPTQNHRDFQQEEEIRKLGKLIVQRAERLSTVERLDLQQSISNSKHWLLITLLTLLLAGLGLSRWLTRSVIQPLRQLQQRMTAIAGGQLTTLPLDSQEQEIIALTAAFNQMLAQLETRQQHLHRTDKLAALGTLLAGVAHELNNPLSNISSSCQILQEELGMAELQWQQELLTQIEEQTERTRLVVRSLLEFAKDREFKQEILPLLQLIQDTLRFLRGQLPTGISIQLQISETLLIYADKQRMQQALLNLLKNAVEAMGEQGHLELIAKEIDSTSTFSMSSLPQPITQAHPWIQLIIQDDGAGIEDAVLPKIFDPFFTTKPIGHGNGLGLSIVHEIITAHKGYIQVENINSKQPHQTGTRFTLHLPAPSIPKEK